MSRWMILGASPSAQDNCLLPVVDFVAGAGKSILFYRPDYYFIIERRSLWLHPEELKLARVNGTKVIVRKFLIPNVIEKLQAEGKYSGDYPHDFAINLKNDWKDWEPGDYVNANSGAVALQWAINHGATEIHLVGCEGYRGPGHIDYCDGTASNKHNKQRSEKEYVPLLKKIIKKCPEIKFFVYGNSTYKLKNENVTHS